MRVPQLSFSYTTWAEVCVPGAAAATLGHSFSIAVTSSRTSVLVLPHPNLRPPKFLEPELTKSMLEPRFAICFCTVWSAPCPIPTIAITAPTPMMMPSMVRTERILFRASARKAICNVESRSINASLVFQYRHRLQRFSCAHTISDHFVAPDLAIAKDHSPFRELGNVMLVRHQDDGEAFVIERLKNLHHLDGGAAVEVPGGL